MTYEMNEPGPEASRRDSASHAENTSSEQIGADNCSSGTTEEGMPKVPDGEPLPCLVKGRKQKLDLVVGRRYVLPDDESDEEGAHLLMVFSEFAEEVYTFTDEHGEGEYSFQAKDLQGLEKYVDWNGQFSEHDAQHSVAPVAQESDDISKQVGQSDQPDAKSRPAAAEDDDVAVSESAATLSETFIAAGMDNEGGTTNETSLINQNITAPPTFVTGVTEASLAIFSMADYSKHTDDELHQANLDNLAEFDRLRLQLESYAYEKVLPALNVTIERFNRQGCRMGGKSEIAEYLTSIGYNYATVRKWNERCRKRLLKAAAPTKPIPSNPLTPNQQVVAEALEAQGCKKGEARNLAKAATGNTFQERFKSALASRVSSTTVGSESNDEARPEPVPDSREPQPPIECGDLTPERGTVEESQQVAEGGSVFHTASFLAEDQTDNPADSAESASVRGDVVHSRLIRPAPGAISEQLVASAIELAKAIIEGGGGGKFPGALDLLQDANVPVPSIAPGPGPEQVYWKDVLTHLMDKMEQYGDRLPVAVTTEMRGIRKLLLLDRTPRLTPDAQGTPAVGEKATRGYWVKEKKKTDTAGVHYAVARDRDKEPYGYYGTRQEAESVCESLNHSHVASIGDVA